MPNAWEKLNETKDTKQDTASAHPVYTVDKLTPLKIPVSTEQWSVVIWYNQENKWMDINHFHYKNNNSRIYSMKGTNLIVTLVFTYMQHCGQPPYINISDPMPLDSYGSFCKRHILVNKPNKAHVINSSTVTWKW